MDFFIGLLGVTAAVAIPIYVQRKEHPRREVRYAVTLVSRSPVPTIGGYFDVRVLVWSTSRADIPSSSFDSGDSVVFRFSSPVAYAPTLPEQPGRLDLRLTSPRELTLSPRLIRPDFATAIVLRASGPFDLDIDSPLIDIRLVRDMAAERPNLSDQERVVAKSKARAHVSFLAVSAWFTIASFAMFAVGIAISLSDEVVGHGIGIPGMLGTPVGLISLIVAGIRRLVSNRKPIAGRPLPGS